MVLQNVLLTTSKTLVLELDSAPAKPYLPPCSLQWHHKKLWVSATQDKQQNILPALKRRDWLKQCLQNSIVDQVCLDSKLGETGIKLWAEVCRESHKQVFLDIPLTKENCHQADLIAEKLKIMIEQGIAAVLLLLFSPIILLMAMLIKLSTKSEEAPSFQGGERLTPSSIFWSQWRVGQRGRLFQVYYFRTRASHQCSPPEDHSSMTVLGKGLDKFNLDELPHLFNVLRGEMSLFGSRSRILAEALDFSNQGLDSSIPYLQEELG